MPSNAGVMFVQRTCLAVNTGTSALTNPLSQYGVTGVNDTGPIPFMVEARGFKKWTFQLIGSGSGYAFSVLYTADPVAYKVWTYAMNPAPSSPFYGQVTLTSLPASSWSLMPGPSSQSGEGSVSNPLVGGVTTFIADQAFIGIRVVLTAVSAATGSVSIVANAEP